MSAAKDIDALFFYRGGRQERLADATEGRAPREFYYGMLHLDRLGYRTKMAMTREPYSGPVGWLFYCLETVWSRLSKLGIRLYHVHRHLDTIERSHAVVSTSDGFNVTLGLYFALRRRANKPYIIGLFHGLSDFENKAPRLLAPLVRAILRRAMKGLDKIVFFGPHDREVAVSRLSIPLNKTAELRFGVDSTFWAPPVQSNGATSDYAVAVGSDPNRDFDLLCRCGSPHRLKILTSLNVALPRDNTTIELIRGSYHHKDLNDDDVRRLYHEAFAVLVPLKDVAQPTGYSVTLQSMACGKAVVLSRIRGLWSPDLLRDGENCLLVPPNDPAAFAEAIRCLASDHNLRFRLGAAARKTVEKHFDMPEMDRGIEALVRGCHALADGPPVHADMPAVQ